MVPVNQVPVGGTVKCYILEFKYLLRLGKS